MKQDLRVVVTRRMIQEALLKLLETKPIDKIRINELCETSGVNRATFYRHYETLQDVLREIQTELIRNMPRTEDHPKTLEDARAKIETMCNYMYAHAAVLKVLFSNCTDDDMTRSLTELYEELLSQNPRELLFPKHNADTHQILIILVGGASYSLLKNWILGNVQKTPAELTEILFSIIRDQSPFSVILEN